MGMMLDACCCAIGVDYSYTQQEMSLGIEPESSVDMAAVYVRRCVALSMISNCLSEDVHHKSFVAPLSKPLLGFLLRDLYLFISILHDLLQNRLGHLADLS